MTAEEKEKIIAALKELMEEDDEFKAEMTKLMNASLRTILLGGAYRVSAKRDDPGFEIESITFEEMYKHPARRKAAAQKDMSDFGMDKVTPQRLDELKRAGDDELDDAEKEG